MRLFSIILVFSFLLINCNAQSIYNSTSFQLDSIAKCKLNHLDSLLYNDSCNVNLIISKAEIFYELKETDLALYYYFKVINIDSLNLIALYNIGAIYYNKAQEFYLEQDPISLEEYRYKIISAENYFNISRMFFSKVLSIESDNKDAIRIYNQLNLKIKCNDWIKMY